MPPVELVPRLLSKAQAAAYLGLTGAGFDNWRRTGKVPAPLPGTSRWDKVAIDAMIDDLSKLSVLRARDAAHVHQDEVDPLDRFRRRLEERREERRRKKR